MVKWSLNGQKMVLSGQKWSRLSFSTNEVININIKQLDLHRSSKLQFNFENRVMQICITSDFRSFDFRYIKLEQFSFFDENILCGRFFNSMG